MGNRINRNRDLSNDNMSDNEDVEICLETSKSNMEKFRHTEYIHQPSATLRSTVNKVFKVSHIA